MPSQQRFEGAVLEDLLEDVRSRFGDDVAIIEANRVRRGGVGGFFTKELFEVVVELSDDRAELGPVATSPAAPPSATTRAASTRPVRTRPLVADPEPARTLLDLVDRVDDGPGDGPASEATIQRLLAMTAEAHQVEPDPGPEPDPLTELLQRVHDQRARGTAPDPAPRATISSDSESFADVLGRITHATRTDPTSAPAPAASHSVFTPIEDDEPFQHLFTTAPAAEASPTTSVVEPARQQVPQEGVRSIPTPPAEPVGGSVVDSVAATPQSPAPLPARAKRVRADVLAVPTAPIGADELEGLGLPAPLALSSLSASDRVGALVELASTFPAAPAVDVRPGAVMVLVGDRSGMRTAIRWVQDRMGLGPEQIVLATRDASRSLPGARRITGHADAFAQRERAVAEICPLLVVVDAPVGMRRTAWARHVIDALAPDSVWGVVGATRKPEDIIEWGERIGGVDALAVHGCAETASPASVLTTGLPVGLVDGQWATPARWAALLDERLSIAA